MLYIIMGTSEATPPTYLQISHPSLPLSMRKKEVIRKDKKIIIEFNPESEPDSPSWKRSDPKIPSSLSYNQILPGRYIGKLLLITSALCSFFSDYSLHPLCHFQIKRDKSFPLPPGLCNLSCFLCCYFPAITKSVCNHSTESDICCREGIMSVKST